jgi:hypothetical protein
MATHTLTVTISEDLYDQVEEQARSTARSIDELVALALIRFVVPLRQLELSPLMEAELQAMEALSNEALWSIVRSTENADKIALYDLLSERNSNGRITPVGRKALDELNAEADALMLRVAHAYSLLQDRGQTPSTATEQSASAE